MIQSRFYEILIEPVLSFVMPALCVSCKNPLPSGRRIICPSCFSDLPALPEDYVDVLKNEIENRHFRQLYVLFQFSETFKELIHLFKYQRYLTLAKYFAEALAGRFELSEYDLVTSIPLNPVREKERGYNQSALIAKELAILLKRPYDNKLIFRTLNTVSQTKLNKEERLLNVKSAFICNKDLKGKKILLIDDVITTGSTTNACAEVLIAQGSQFVDIAVLATPIDYLQQELEKSEN